MGNSSLRWFNKSWLYSITLFFPLFKQLLINQNLPEAIIFDGYYYDNWNIFFHHVVRFLQLSNSTRNYFTNPKAFRVLLWTYRPQGWCTESLLSCLLSLFLRKRKTQGTSHEPLNWWSKILSSILAVNLREDTTVFRKLGRSRCKKTYIYTTHKKD